MTDNDMIMDANIPWLLLAGVTIISSAVGSYLTTYLTKKAENLATKEDISGITRQIESVKNEFGFITQQRLAIKEKQREVLLKFLDDCFVLVYEKMHYEVPIGDIDGGGDADQLIREHQHTTWTLFASVQIHKSKLTLYFPREDALLVAAQELVDASNYLKEGFNEYYSKYLLHVTKNMHDADKLIKRKESGENIDPRDVIKSFTLVSQASDEYRENIKKYIEHFEGALVQFSEIVNDHFSDTSR